jgi:predicted DCC family thiol-disulfide oxidoreductase YuxK
MISQTPTLIFDGDCGFCTSAANFIVKRSKVAITAHPWQLIDTTEYGVLQPQAQDRVYMVVDGQAFGGHEAFAAILRLQNNWLLSTIALVIVVPPICWLARIGYRLVAKYRHKLPGGTPACKLEAK